MEGKVISANARVIQEVVFVVKVKVSPEEEGNHDAILTEACRLVEDHAVAKMYAELYGPGFHWVRESIGDPIRNGAARITHVYHIEEA